MKKAGFADHRHERAKYLHDRDQGVRARRLDYPPKPFDLRERVSIVGRAMSEPKNRVGTAPNADLDGMP